MASKIIIISFTRDRLSFTKTCFALLHSMAGMPFTHIVLDNGSIDGTQEWLESYTKLYSGVQEPILCPKNLGIAKAMNLIKSLLTPCDYVLKFDNDCRPVSGGFLQSLVVTQQLLEKQTGARWVVSPKVLGLNKQPSRFFGMTLPTGEKIGQTDTMGGICRLVPYDIFMQFTANEKLPKAYGVDGQLNEWCVFHNIRMGYCEDIDVQHYLTTEGQEKALPEYFERKAKEELPSKD